ncbi:hypothetical protein [Clostridium ganghwense]|uniref:Uncharacterized protein n=1 Tax=Clostridium ganghwense TaxID=312089 RepID=A0ABT4CUS4_9CLOT|nr:hypothetical protein [Clostridium ganghwense]MCY6372816.1 hypothetical protein [Clostridium ganghwense]
MKEMKCSNCGYIKKFNKIIGNNINSKVNCIYEVSKHSFFSVNNVFNITKIQCPKCGEIGRWIRKE